MMDIADIPDWGPWYDVLRNWRDGCLTKKEIVQALQSDYDVPQPAKELLCDAVMDTPQNNLVAWSKGPKGKFARVGATSPIQDCDFWRKQIDYFREHNGEHEFDRKEFKYLADEIERRASLKGSAAELAIGLVAEQCDENYYTLRDRYYQHKREQAVALARHFMKKYNANEDEAARAAVHHCGSTAKAVKEGLK